MKTTWVRDVSEEDRARLDVDPWEVRLHTGFHLLYDFATDEAVSHLEWPASALRRRAAEALGKAVVLEVDSAVAGASEVPAFAQRREADQALADAWRAIPVEALGAEPKHGPRREYGVTFRLGALEVGWVLPRTPRESAEHEVAFPTGPLRVGTLRFVAECASAFVFLPEDGLPLVTAPDGRPLDGFDRQAPRLGFGRGPFSTVFVSSVATLRGHVFLRCHSNAHRRGAAFAVTTGNWWARLEPTRGIVARWASGAG